MKTTSTIIKNNALFTQGPLPVLFSLTKFCLFFIIGFTCSCAPSGHSPIIWHQHYQAIEQEKIIDHAWSCLAEAQVFFGPPTDSIENIHIRRSIPRINPATLSRADIVDWKRLLHVLLTDRDRLPIQKIWNKLDGKTKEILTKMESPQTLTLVTKLNLIEALNKAIEDSTFSSPSSLLSQNELQQNLHKTATKKTSLASDTNISQMNRRNLEYIFKDSLLPMPKHHRTQKGIELCERIKSPAGHFVIYLSAGLEEENFSAQIAHETFHLLNTSLFDWYVEGLGNVFSEKHCRDKNISWQAMENYFEKRRKKDPYAISYFMMREINDIAGSDMKTFLRHAAWTDRKKKKMHINIDGWLETLTLDKQKKIIETIEKFSPLLQRNRGTRNSFFLPATKQ